MSPTLKYDLQPSDELCLTGTFQFISFMFHYTKYYILFDLAGVLGVIGNPEYRPYVGQRVHVGNSPPKLATVLRVAPRARLIVQHDGTDLPVKVIANFICFLLSTLFNIY